MYEQEASSFFEPPQRETNLPENNCQLGIFGQRRQAQNNTFAQSLTRYSIKTMRTADGDLRGILNVSALQECSRAKKRGLVRVTFGNREKKVTKTRLTVCIFCSDLSIRQFLSRRALYYVVLSRKTNSQEQYCSTRGLQVPHKETCETTEKSLPDPVQAA